MLVVNSRDFQLWQVEAFAEHVHADDDLVLLLDNFTQQLDPIRHLAVDENG
ncbi:hypothetical protein D3C84_948220 [compost metagenome]